MFKHTHLLVLSTLLTSLALSGCQPKPEPNNTESVASEVVPEPVRLIGDIQKLNLNLPQCEGNDCSEFKVERLQSNQDFIDQSIDDAILKILAMTLSDAPLAAAQPSDEEAGSTVVVSSAKLKLEQKIVPYKDAFLTLDQELKALSAGHPIQLTVRPKILNADAPIATVVLNTSSYLGGAHGSSAQDYFNFDLNAAKQIGLQDLLLPQQSTALQAKAYEAFKAWVIDTELAENVAEYEQAWQFKMTENFYLAKQGLILQYAEYDIGPYVVGLPRLVIPYAELVDILKPEYLPAEFKQQAQTATSEIPAP